MEALVIHAPGDLRVEEVPTPELGAGQLRVRVRCGGICGSDLHYYQHGGFGTVRIKEPMVLGHEVAGVIEAVGAGVARLRGRRARRHQPEPALRPVPLLPAGPAEPLPGHALLRQRDAHAARAGRLPPADRGRALARRTGWPTRVSDGEGSMAEPLSVALHAVRRAGPLLGKRVLVTGCGPIGALAIIAARRAGAAHIVATDVGAHTLGKALKVGADEVVNVAEEPEGLARFTADKGSFDVLFEASGNQRALVGAFDALRPRGIIVQLGLGGEMTLPINTIVAKEFDLRGAFRFHEEFAVAVELLNKGLVDVKPLISATLSVPRLGARLRAGGRSLAGDEGAAC